jgi:hypothetical protein
MTDIVERLRGWFKDVNAVSAIDLMDEAAAEIERLRTLAEQATPSECSVRGEGTETAGERLVERLSITQAMLDDNEKLRSEIASLREAIRSLADQDATLSVQGGSVTVTMDATLTDAEHDALEFAAETGRVAMHDEATLRKLLERLK